MLRCKINPDLKDLNTLHRDYQWIPNEIMIRPSDKILEDKQCYMRYIDNMWMSSKDFILATHFKYDTDIEDGHIYVPTAKQGEWNFSESMFPYNIKANSHHYVLWNSSADYYTQFDEAEINKIITENLKKITEGDKFNFVWYINPKPSIPELWHCQVFWI
jgi:hypothetical protein